VEVAYVCENIRHGVIVALLVGKGEDPLVVKEIVNYT
jgi:hypothetical protein